VSDAPLMVTVSGLRGIVGQSLTSQVLERYIDASAEFVRGQGGGGSKGSGGRIVLGRDGRAGGEHLVPAIVEAWERLGFDIVDLGVAATPTTGLMVTELNADAGMEITASHNPAEWNGLKLITAEGRAPLPSEAESIVRRFHENVPLEPAEVSGGYDERSDAAERHVERVCQHIDGDPIRTRRFRVVLDSVNASGGRGAKRLLRALGCEVIELACDDSGVFPHTPEPVEANLTGLCGAVKSLDADLGFAQDPDADRLAIVDNTGRYIGEEYTLVLACEELLHRAGSGEHVLVANLSTSRMIDDLAQRAGNAVVKRSAVGEANVVDVMQREGALAGGEGNGGVIWPRVVLIRDSLSGMALVLSLLARREEALAAVVDAMPGYAIVKEKLPLEEGLAESAAQRLVEAYDGARIDRQDGLRVDLADRWVHVRPSNTEPILRLIAEAPQASSARSLVDEVRSLLTSA
jgi:phosphomannomutase